MQIRSTIQHSPPLKQTPYQQMKNSKVGRLVRDNKVGSGAATIAATAATAGGALQSETFSQIARYGIVPAFGAGVATLGAAAVHDAVVNDVGSNNLRATGKMAAGTAAALGGIQVLGVSYDIPVLDRALTGIVFDHGQALLGSGLLAGAALAGKTALQQFQKVGDAENKSIPLALGTGASVGAVAAGLGGTELLGRDLGMPILDKAFSGTLEFLSQSSAASVAGGALIVGGALVAGTQAVKNLASGQGNDYATASMASGALAGSLGGLELLGHGLGLEATTGLFSEHTGLVGGMSVSALGGAITRHAAKQMKKNGLTPSNTLTFTTGLGALGGGVGLAASSLGAWSAADAIGQGTSVAAGTGLALSAFAFAKDAVQAGKEGRLASTAFHGTGAAASAAGSLYALGSGLGIEALEQAGSKVIDFTLKPLTEHIISPTLQFFFENPALGGIGLALAVGGFAYSQLKN